MNFRNGSKMRRPKAFCNNPDESDEEGAHERGDTVKSYYLMAIENRKKGNRASYEQALLEVCGWILSWEEVKQLDEDCQRELFFNLKRKIALEESKYDVQKLARAIQNSRSGAGGSAMTMYLCAFCGAEEMWGNTAVPKICAGCAKEMANTIILSGMEIEKG